ncbi:MAG: peptidoglycan DD-metalloendopeptidase family protein [candidate division Zixibacteria bacterium]|jgi:murein DD-endopeptidase MepM/ murein hydrolase activator NlpD|nr:peptidoglycan DD-metalloendopeptidase family protein [candidate division Zixibacteria bacterium]
MPTKYVTIMLIPDGTEARAQWRIRQWILRLIVGGIIFILVGIVLFFSFYGSVLSRAAITERVQSENEGLKRYRYKVQLLEDNLREAREMVTRLTKLAGVDFEFPEMPTDSTIFAQLDRTAIAVMARPVSADYSVPVGLPIDGFISQQFSPSDDHYHPGVDIACAIGTPVLATGSGLVEFVGFDSLYGNLVVVRHNDTVTSMYGHNQEILVAPGSPVTVGARIALSGNTGQSTAPHLHYEIRIKDEPINPLDNPYDKEDERQ